MTVRRSWIIAILLFVALSIVGLGLRPLIVPDEPRYGIIPAEMVENGNWLALRMAGFVYYEKPPLGYWFTAASLSAFGHNAFALRLPSAIATLIAALVATWMAVRITGRRDDGPLAFMVQTTTLAPLIFGSVALLDPPFAALVSLSMGALYCGCTTLGRSRAGWLALAGVAAGFAFLTKGLLAFAIPAISAIVFLAWERRWKDMITMPWIPLGAAVITVAPFAWIIHRAEPGFWNYFIVVEHFRRIAQPDSNQHPEPWWFFLALFPIGAMIWSIAWPNAWKGLRDAVDWRIGFRFMVSWIVGPLALLSFSSGKLPTYLLPLFAPVAVLVALGLRRAHSSGSMTMNRAAIAARWMLRLCAAASFVIALIGGRKFGIPTLWDSNESLQFVVIGVAFLLWAQLDAWSWNALEARTWLVRTTFAPVPILLTIPFFFPSALFQASKNPWPLFDRLTEQLRTSTLLVTSHEPAHALSWATGRYDIVIAGDASEFDNELGIQSEQLRRIKWDEVGARIIQARATSTSQSVAVVCPTSEADRILQTAGVPVVDMRESDGNLTVLYWR